jgi:hypothetical protein
MVPGPLLCPYAYVEREMFPDASDVVPVPPTVLLGQKNAIP